MSQGPRVMSHEQRAIGHEPSTTINRINRIKHPASSTKHQASRITHSASTKPCASSVFLAEAIVISRQVVSIGPGSDVHGFRAWRNGLGEANATVLVAFPDSTITKAEPGVSEIGWW